jgi:uncharacterized membrane protein
MVFLALTVAAFAVWHLLPVLPSIKAKLQAAIGAAYGPVFGIVSVVLLGLVILAWRMADFVHVYDPPEGGRYVTFALVLVAFICLGIFIFRGTLRLKLRLPLAIGVVFWGAGHLFANGDMASLILFSGMIGYGSAHLVLGLAGGYRPQGEARAGHDLMSILAGIALYGLMTQLHIVLIGVPVVTLGG